jgi:Rap1a immunity proteins
LKRSIAAALGAVCVLASPVMAVEPSNFNATTTRDLVALCSDQPGDALYAEAKQFCYGFLAGIAQFHRSMVNEDGIKPIACPKQEVTRAELAAVLLDWTKANPQSNDELPAQSLSRAAAAKWPCKG